MNCKRCNFELPDDSVYCGRCGSRVDGKKACPSCGKDICEEYVYCNYCGARVDGKHTCECGNVFEGNFCFVCGKEAKGAKKQVEKKSGGSKLPFIFNTIAEGVLALGALFALIFVFFIGAGVKFPESIASMLKAEDLAIGKSCNIFYFFGQYFKEANLAEGAGIESVWFAELMKTQTGLTGALGATVSALTILSTVTFSVLALVFYGVSWGKKSKVDFTKFAFLAIASYFVGALAYHSIMHAAISANLQGIVNIKVASSLNGATVTVLLLFAVLLPAYFVFRILARGKEEFTFAPIFKTAAGVVLTALGLVVAFVAVKSGFALELTNEGAQICLSTSFSEANALWIASFAKAFDNTAVGYQKATTAFEISVALYSVAQWLQVLGVIFAGATVVCAFRNGADGKSGPVVLFAALTAGLSLLVLTLSCVGFSAFTEAYSFYDADSVISPVFTAEIVSFVFSLLLLGGSIAAKVVEKRKK